MWQHAHAHAHQHQHERVFPSISGVVICGAWLAVCEACCAPVLRSTCRVQCPQMSARCVECEDVVRGVQYVIQGPEPTVLDNRKGEMVWSSLLWLRYASQYTTIPNTTGVWPVKPFFLFSFETCTLFAKCWFDSGYNFCYSSMDFWTISRGFRVLLFSAVEADSRIFPASRCGAVWILDALPVSRLSWGVAPWWR